MLDYRKFLNLTILVKFKIQNIKIQSLINKLVGIAFIVMPFSATPRFFFAPNMRMPKDMNYPKGKVSISRYLGGGCFKG